MNNEEWSHHRAHADHIYPLGFVSRTSDGRFKIEGQDPMSWDDAKLYASREVNKVNERVAGGGGYGRLNINSVLQKMQGLI